MSNRSCKFHFQLSEYHRVYQTQLQPHHGLQLGSSFERVEASIDGLGGFEVKSMAWFSFPRVSMWKCSSLIKGLLSGATTGENAEEGMCGYPGDMAAGAIIGAAAGGGGGDIAIETTEAGIVSRA